MSESIADDAKQAEDIKVRANLDFSHLGYANVFFLSMVQLRVVLVMLGSSTIMPVQQGLHLLHGLSAGTLPQEDAKAAITQFFESKCHPASAEQRRPSCADLLQSTAAAAARSKAETCPVPLDAQSTGKADTCSVPLGTQAVVKAEACSVPLDTQSAGTTEASSVPSDMQSAVTFAPAPLHVPVPAETPEDESKKPKLKKGAHLRYPLFALQAFTMHALI
jgi:hypothetical protein